MLLQLQRVQLLALLVSFINLDLSDSALKTLTAVPVTLAPKILSNCVGATVEIPGQGRQIAQE